MASADWSAVPKTIIYTATSSRSFLLSQEVRFAWRVVVKSSPLFIYVWCGLSCNLLRATKRSTTVYHFDNVPANGSLATETSICVSVVRSLM
jgi:hypothetical protein